MSYRMFVALLAILLLVPPGNAAAQAPTLVGEITNEEAGAGAAAVSVVALRCRPDAFETVKKAAFGYLANRVRDYPPEERERVIDAAERKLRALTIASGENACSGVVNLRIMAQAWGYANLLARP